MLQRLRAVEWDTRSQPLEELLHAYEARHTACVESNKLPGPYLVVRMQDDASGIGNQLPSVVTGTHFFQQPVNLSATLVTVLCLP